MDQRELPKSSPPNDPQLPRENWAGNYTYSTNTVLQPSTLAETRDAVRSVSHVRALGTRHCFNGIADSPVAQISTLRLRSFKLNAAQNTVSVGAGIKYGDLAVELDKSGFALHNLASLPHISVAGSVATATHGSGLRNGNLATAVTALELVSADGSVHTLTRSKDGERFLAAVVNLGALGIVTSLTLNIEPRYEMTQIVYRDLDFSQLEHNLEAVMSAAYSVSLFTDWQHHRAGEVWIKRRVDQGGEATPPRDFFGATLAQEKLHPILGQDPARTTDQLNTIGPWYDRLPHFKMEFTPSVGREIQTEFFVPFERGYEAILAVESLRDQITPHLFVTEIRAIAADDLWLSMNYKRRSLAIHFTWKPDPAAVSRIVPQIEATLAPFQPRPHWGKLFTLNAVQLAPVYPRWNDFKQLAQQFDPEGKFRNAFMKAHVSG
ncbi:MAG TPA: D-arabinono-1,4-lactone oxidase [Bryocella sp.]|nr:D-arabinono-1,4-lactone oxidase [Bryocella sp.]